MSHDVQLRPSLPMDTVTTTMARATSYRIAKLVVKCINLNAMQAAFVYIIA